METNICISIKNAEKAFKEQVVLQNINLKLEAGKIHGLIGRNGSGKTVLMKCICGFMPLDKGEIFVSGKKIGKDVDFSPDTGIIIENPGFLPQYSGFRNLKFLASIRGQITDDQIKQTIELVGLNPKEKKRVSNYSLGMKQRLGLAQALMENPSLLFLDEPMNGLDNQGVEEMRELFCKLRDEGKTIILASHNREDIDTLCDSVCEMDKGKLTVVR